jgi:glycosyltransferase involved in cell wall biosynthesis
MNDMARIVSILTAAFTPIADYFADTLVSVAGQFAPAGWGIEWIVQEDGESPRLREIVDTVPFGCYAANNARLGIAATRNLALSRATGEIVQMLDHDDILLPLAIARLVKHFDDQTIHGRSARRPSSGRVTAQIHLCTSIWAHPGGGSRCLGNGKRWRLADPLRWPSRAHEYSTRRWRMGRTSR